MIKIKNEEITKIIIKSKKEIRYKIIQDIMKKQIENNRK